MKDPQQQKTAIIHAGKYIKADNERFSTEVADVVGGY